MSERSFYNAKTIKKAKTGMELLHQSRNRQTNIRKCKFSRRLRLSTTSLRRMWYSVAGVSAMFYGKTQKLRVE